VAAVPVASVIIPARNAAGTLGATLNALAAQDCEHEFEVIVVDDGSDDATPAVASGSDPAVRLLREHGVGPGPARNAGAAVAAGEILAFTDADCVPTSGWLRSGIEALGGADLVQGAVDADPNTPPGPFDRSVWVTRELGLYECASLFVHRAIFDEIGGFEDWLGARVGKPLAEDAWFGWRARRRGAKTAFSPQALVHHAVFRRGALGFIGERVRLYYFPAIARKMPELRRTLFFGRVFLSSRSASFDLALAGALAAAALGSPPLLLAMLPWLWLAARDTGRWRSRAPLALIAGAGADLVGFAALVAGSVRARSLLL
jgi:glycosyltransferase involved in cell wall biosynthesis